MGNVTGSLTLPTPQRTSQLINDTRFSSIREYVLNSSNLSGSNKLDIVDLIPGSVIYRIDLIILSAFSDTSGMQKSIEISCDNGGVLMDSEWNDPNMIGTYSTNCYTNIRTSNDVVHIMHNLDNIISGSAILRLYVYNNIDSYTRMLTSDGLYYHTVDTNGVNVVTE